MSADGPRTRYATAGDGTYIAYQVIGDGPTDVVVSLGVVSNIDLLWEQPRWVRLMEGLTSFARVILIDRRGIGQSDRKGDFPSWEVQMDDVLAVMSAVGSSRATLVGSADAGSMFLLFAATHPERTNGLVLFGALARWSRADDYPCGVSAAYFDAFRTYVQQDWGSGDDAYVVAPSVAGDPTFRTWWGRYQRLATSPGQALAFIDLCSRLDARSALSAIQCPTLVLHRRGDRLLRVEHGRYLAAAIPNAKYVELDGEDHLMWVGDTAVIVAEIEELVTGSRGGVVTDRVLSTVLFTDIVGSTDLAGEIGDTRWRSILEQHDAMTHFQIERHRGRLVQFTGDGAVATFDGPARAVRCAMGIRDSVRSLGILVRAGLHTGEIELRGDGIAGIAVHLAQRVSAVAGPNQVVVSRTVVDLVAGSGISFSGLGDHTLKGVREPWSLFEVVAPV